MEEKVTTDVEAKLASGDTKALSIMLKGLVGDSEKLSGIMAQWKELSVEDRQWFKDAWAAQGQTF